MSIYEIIILSVALALDALIVSFSYGAVIKEKRCKSAFSLAFPFGFFQMLMPVLGWYFTNLVYYYLERYSKWIVFTIFFILGCKFLKDAITKTENNTISCISLTCILCLALATSIDAFGAGASIKLLDIEIWKPAVIIGIITYTMSFFGFLIAGILKNISEKHVGILGALILFYLALKSVI